MRASAFAQASEGSIPSAIASRDSVSVVGRRAPVSMNAMACRFRPERAATSPNDNAAVSRASRSTARRASERSEAN